MPNKARDSGLSGAVLDKLCQVFSTEPAVKKVYLYGSRAKGNYHTGSDIDLSIVAEALSFADLLQLQTKVEALLLPYQVDMNLYHEIHNDDLLAHIQRVGIVLYHHNAGSDPAL